MAGIIKFIFLFGIIVTQAIILTKLLCCSNNVLKNTTNCLGAVVPFVCARYMPFFRKDYTYFEDFNAHYKIHWDLHGLSWEFAFSTCDNEGAILFYPKLVDEWTVVKNLTQGLVKPPNVTDAFIGIHNKFAIGEFVTVDGHPTLSSLHMEGSSSSSRLPSSNCVLMNIDTGSFKVHSCASEPLAPLPFVCKRVDDRPCRTIDREYKYNESLGKCYKINKREYSWYDAMRTCYFEGGILTVLSNAFEVATLSAVLESETTYHVGTYRTIPHEEFYSVKGKRIDKLYQRDLTTNPNRNQIAYDEYGNALTTVKHDCGGVRIENNILYTTETDCNDKLPFICEMEANKI